MKFLPGWEPLAYIINCHHKMVTNRNSWWCIDCFSVCFSSILLLHSNNILFASWQLRIAVFLWFLSSPSTCKWLFQAKHTNSKNMTGKTLTNKSCFYLILWKQWQLAVGLMLNALQTFWNLEWNNLHASMQQWVCTSIRISLFFS